MGGGSGCGVTGGGASGWGVTAGGAAASVVYGLGAEGLTCAMSCGRSAGLCLFFTNTGLVRRTGPCVPSTLRFAVFRTGFGLAETVGCCAGAGAEAAVEVEAVACVSSSGSLSGPSEPGAAVAAVCSTGAAAVCEARRVYNPAPASASPTPIVKAIAIFAIPADLIRLP